MKNISVIMVVLVALAWACGTPEKEIHYVTEDAKCFCPAKICPNSDTGFCDCPTCGDAGYIIPDVNCTPPEEEIVPQHEDIQVDVEPPPLLKVFVSVEAEILSGIATIGAVVEGGKAVMGVEFYVDSLRIDTDFIPPFNTSVNTSEFQDGFHLISVFTADQYGQTSSDSKQLTFDNTPPLLLSHIPAEDQTIFYEDGPLHLELEVDDPAAMQNVSFRANGLLVAEFLQPPFAADVQYSQLFIEENSLPKNVYIQFEAVDYLGQTTSKAFNVLIQKRHIWTYETLGEIWATGSLTPQGNIVFGNLNSKLFSVTQNGNENWIVNASGSITVQSAVNNGDSSVYYAGLDGNVYSVNSSGSSQWSINMQSPPGGGLVFHNNTVYVASYAGSVYALSPGNGNTQWEADLPAFLSSSPSVSPDGTVYVGCQDYSLYAVNNGSVLWDIPTGGEVWSSPGLGADQSIYFGSNDQWLYAVTKDGNPKWVEEIGGEIWGRPLVASDGFVYVASTSKYVTRVDSTTGQQIWSTKTEGLSYSSPVEGPNGYIYIGTTGGKVFCLDPEDGHVRWAYQVGDSIHGTPLIVGKKLFIGSTDRSFYSLWVDTP
jgi:outer membrane protein assembly factor BamB